MAEQSEGSPPAGGTAARLVSDTRIEEQRSRASPQTSSHHQTPIVPEYSSTTEQQPSSGQGSSAPISWGSSLAHLGSPALLAMVAAGTRMAFWMMPTPTFWSKFSARCFTASRERDA